MYLHSVSVKHSFISTDARWSGIGYIGLEIGKNTFAGICYHRQDCTCCIAFTHNNDRTTCAIRYITGSVQVRVRAWVFSPHPKSAIRPYVTVHKQSTRMCLFWSRLFVSVFPFANLLQEILYVCDCGEHVLRVVERRNLDHSLIYASDEHNLSHISWGE